MPPLAALAGLALLCCAPAHAAAVRMDDASEAALASGEVVLVDRTPARPGSISVEGVVDVRTTSDALWRALLDFQARVTGNSSVRMFRYYKPSTATEQWGEWEVSHFGVTVRYFNHYIINRAAGVLVHELDPTQVNSMNWSRGVYSIAPSPATPGALRLTYTVDTDFGTVIPGFIKTWLAGQGVREYLAELVQRAEAHR